MFETIMKKERISSSDRLSLPRKKLTSSDQSLNLELGNKQNMFT